MLVVHVAYHHEPDGWWADSLDVPGWSAAAESVDELRELVEEGVRFSLNETDLVVHHTLDEPLLSGPVYDFVRGEASIRARPGLGDQIPTGLRLAATH